MSSTSSGRPTWRYTKYVHLCSSSNSSNGRRGHNSTYMYMYTWASPLDIVSSSGLCVLPAGTPSSTFISRLHIYIIMLHVYMLACGMIVPVFAPWLCMQLRFDQIYSPHACVRTYILNISSLIYWERS